MSKVHLDSGARAADMVVARCGWLMPPSRSTTDESKVTCVRCGDAMRSLSAPPPVASAPGFFPVRMGCRVAAVLRAEIPRAEWYSWRDALRKLVQWWDDGAPLPSSSDVDRTPGPSGPACGDKAQRAAETWAEVASALTQACDTDAERDAVILRIVGRPVRREPASVHGERRVKTRVIHRVDCDPIEIAGTTGILAGDLDTLVRRVGTAVEDALYSRGLLATRDDWLVVRTEVPDMRVTGWRRIAEYVGRAEHTVRRAREWDPPIPVRIFGGTVWAESAELDQWLASEPKTKAAAREIR